MSDDCPRAEWREVRRGSHAGIESAAIERLEGEWRCFRCGEAIATESVSRRGWEALTGGEEYGSGGILLRSQLVDLGREHDGLPVFGLSQRTLVKRREPHRDDGAREFRTGPIYVYCPRRFVEWRDGRRLEPCGAGQHLEGRAAKISGTT